MFITCCGTCTLKELHFSSGVVILALHMYFICNQGCLGVNLQEWLKRNQVCNGLTFENAPSLIVN